MQEGTSAAESSYRVAPDAVTVFADFRDLQRKPHTYNALHHYEQTGAFMTWLWDETRPETPRSLFARPDKGVRIPFKMNDVDCVVNANVLKLLSTTQQTSTPGYQDSCNYLNAIVEKKGYYSCGMYYPSQWVLPYVLATAMSN